MTHITIYPLAVSTDEAAAKKFWTHSAMMRRSTPSSELTILPIEYADDPNNRISVWSNIDAADLIVALLSEELLSALDDFTDPHTGVNHVLDLIEAKRGKKEYRVIPIRVRESSWNEDGSSFKNLQALPRSGTPIAERREQDSVWSEVIGEVRRVFKEMQAAQYQVAVPQPVQNVSPKATQETAIVAPSFCPQCSSDLYGAKHCRDCGTSVAKSTPIAQPVQARQPVKPMPVIPVSHPAYAPSSAPVASKDAVLLLYHPKDSNMAKQCLLHLQSCGVRVIDGQARIPGSRIRESFRQQVQQCQRAIFLVSADFNAALGSSDAQNILGMIQAEIPTTMLAKSLVIPVRACWYDGLFGMSVETIAPPNWKVNDAFWLEVAQYVARSV